MVTGPHFVREIGGSPMWKPAVDAAAELEALYGFGSYVPTDDASGYYMEDAGSVVALMVFFVDQFDGLFIGTAWTAPSYRWTGLYRRMFEYLLVRAQKAGVPRIGCGVAINNELSKEIHRRLGMRVVAEYYGIDSPAPEAPTK